ncbi:calsyntenin-1-like [Diadema antillarum]|uniref:calsyntenin-1-like n=1 Tax=Diadema antillarum TaxID=105358 RepID=UPI003A8829E7
MLSPALVAHDMDEGTNGRICSFSIEESVPFVINVVDQAAGTGAIQAVSGAINAAVKDCDENREWLFHIQATDCGKPHLSSPKAQVHIVVRDPNNNKPRFVQKSYEARVEEGSMPHKFLQIQAVDDDCSPGFSTICSYDIMSPGMPFKIDIKGRLSAVEPLTSEGGPTYTLHVQSCDCSGLCSDTVPVNIHVSQECQPGWKGVPKRMEYPPGSRSVQLAPRAYLDMCGRLACNSSSLMTTVALQTDHIGFGCDRETYSTQSQRTLCNAEAGSYDLLPRPNAGEQWTKKLTTDTGNESDQIYQFDGVQDAVIVPSQFAPPDNLTERFSISFWMKHHNVVGGEQEYILCKTDSKGSNRHHYGIYIHNCRLVFTYHQEGGDGFFPSQYRWKLRQVCDQEWHRYTLNMDSFQATLYIDGEAQVDPRVSEDWPLHHSNNPTAITVGACYKGAQSKFAQFFTGYLAGLSILPGQVEAPEVVSCMVRCKEGLSFQVGNLPVNVASINTAHTNLTLTGKLTVEFSSVLQQVAYFNARTFPTPGRRPLTISSKASCNGVDISIPDVSSYVMVLQPHEPTISITGSQATSQTAATLSAGIQPFKTVTIVSVMSEEEEEELGAEQQEMTGEDAPTLLTHNLDSCSLLSKNGPLASGELLTIPQAILDQYQLTVVHSPKGMVIKGIGELKTYESILHQVTYIRPSNSKFTEQTLTLHCTELNGRFVSNDFDFRIQVLHQAVRAPNKPSHAKQSVVFSHSNVRVHDKLKENSPKHIASKSAVSSTAMAIVVVLCVGFLLFMIVLGVFRIYAAHKASRNFDGQDMDWDDSALNITVNPMEGPVATGDTDESSEDDDEDSLEDESSSSEEEEEEVEVEVKGTPLEWDDSTLKF